MSKRKVAQTMSNKRKAKKNPKKNGFLLAIAFTFAAVLAIYFVISFISETNENKQKKEELEQLQAKYEQQMQQNQELQDTIEENDEAEIAEKYARENGYVKTDERVYIDITPGT